MLMNDADCMRLMESFGLPQIAREYVIKTRSGPPSRDVISMEGRNTLWRYPSRKMGFTVAAESTLEKNHAVLLDFDDRVLEFWDQPPHVPLLTKDRAGKRRRVPYTPDVLALLSDAICVIQVKTEKTCSDLAESWPDRWIKKDGRYQDLAAENYFTNMGLQHVVITENEINPVKANNLLAISRAAEGPRPVSYRRVAAKIALEVRNRGTMSMARAMKCANVTDTAVILRMLDEHLIAVDVDRADLANPDVVLLGANDKELAAAWKTYTSIGIAEDVEPSQLPGNIEAELVLERLRAIRGELIGKYSQRSIQRWRRRFHQSGKNPWSLIANRSFKGNRQRRISSKEILLIRRIIQTHYLSPSAPSVEASFRRYLTHRDEEVAAGRLHRGDGPVSGVTFRTEIAKLDREVSAMARGGQRSRNAAAAPVPSDHRYPNASRPFQCGHIDHYLADIHVIVGTEGGRRHTRRPWVTVLRDQYSGAALGMSLSFKAPSRSACACVIRDCVRRHGRLPEAIVVDNGSEFGSTYFELLLARLGIAKQSRPPGAPRYGASIESFFKSLSDFLRCFPGSTKNDARGRAVSTRFRGQACARLDIAAVYEAIERFIFEVFNQHPVRGHEICPDQLLIDGMKLASYSGVSVDLDNEFLGLSAIPLKRALTYVPQRGIRHLDRWFYATELTRLSSGAKVQVFEDPWDPDRLYAVINSARVTCFHGRGTGVVEYSIEKLLHGLKIDGGSIVRTLVDRHRQKAIDRLVRQAETRKGKIASKSPPRNKPTLLPRASLKGAIPYKTSRRGGRS